MQFSAEILFSHKSRSIVRIAKLFNLYSGIVYLKIFNEVRHEKLLTSLVAATGIVKNILMQRNNLGKQ